MTDKPALILHVALPVPVRHHFDYLPPKPGDLPQIKPGMRVLVPFGRNKHRVGLVIGSSHASDIRPAKLKPVRELIDDQPLLDEAHMKLLNWASEYYHYPIGELVFTTLPGLLRQGRKAEHVSTRVWGLSELGRNFDIAGLSRARKQQVLMSFLRRHGKGVPADLLNREFDNWRPALKSLLDKGLVEVSDTVMDMAESINDAQEISFNEEQATAFKIISEGLAPGKRFLLDGITGSGKTELYLEAIKQVTGQGKQALVLVPEIGLTPHFISRFQQRIPHNLVVLHSGLSDNERLKAWLRARDGSAKVILGTRSAVWTPLKYPGLYIVDEEHDPSYKQQDGLRYSARDIAVLRASNEKLPLILGSATPSFEALHNVELEKFTRITLKTRAENAVPPRYHIVDLRGQQTTGALSNSLIDAIHRVLAQNRQVLLFQNRRGYSPVIMCHECGWIHQCRRCDMPLTFHKSRQALICHHCGHQERPSDNCHDCQAGDLVQIGHGTERLNETLQECFPSARILRIDRDSTRRKGSMQDYMDEINSGSVDILVGTQILAKGHHFPKVTLVGIIDGDRGLYSNDFRASERMAQLIVQVSGRAGRAEDPGLVMIQTHHPQHPFLTGLVENNYSHFAATQLVERRLANLPPYSYQALLRADSHENTLPLIFLESAARSLKKINRSLDVYGPFPAPIEKRAGRYRFQLLLQANKRSILHAALTPWIDELEQHKDGKRIRWSVDVDPQDLL